MFHIGQRVVIGRKHGEKTLAQVERVNKTSISCRTLESRGTYKNHPVGTKFRVHPNLVAPEGAEPKDERPVLVNILTGEKLVGPAGMDAEHFFESRFS